MRILIYGAGVIGEKSMKNEEYKKLSINEFTKAAGRYESNHAGIYEMCKKDYPDILEELEKEPFNDLLDVLSFAVSFDGYILQYPTTHHLLHRSVIMFHGFFQS